jgi:hypothetical protein
MKYLKKFNESTSINFENNQLDLTSTCKVIKDILIEFQENDMEFDIFTYDDLNFNNLVKTPLKKLPTMVKKSIEPKIYINFEFDKNFIKNDFLKPRKYNTSWFYNTLKHLEFYLGEESLKLFFWTCGGDSRFSILEYNIDNLNKSFREVSPSNFIEFGIVIY